MADDKLPEHDSGSLLKTAVAASPFAASVGIASYRAYQEGGSKAIPASIKEAAKTLNKIKDKVSRPSYNAHIDFMNLGHQKGWFKGQGKAAARTAWMQAMNNVGKYSAQYLPKVASEIELMGDDMVLDAITSMSKHESDVTRAVFSRFRSNFSALQGLPQ